MTTLNTTSKTTSNTATSINALEFAGVLKHGSQQMRKGAINTVLAVAAYMVHTTENASMLECARLRGHDLTVLPSKTSTNKDDKAVREQAKKDSALATRIYEAIPHLNPVFISMLKDLTAYLSSPVEFENEAEKVVDSLGFFAGVVIDTQAVLLEFFESCLPSDVQEKKAAEKEDRRIKAEKAKQAKADKVSGENKAPSTPVESGTKASQAAAQSMAIEYLASLADTYPQLKSTITLAGTVKTKEQAAQVMAQAFEDMLNAANAEIATLKTIKTPVAPSTNRAPRKAKATPAPKAN